MTSAERMINVVDAVQKVRSGMHIVIGEGASAPLLFMQGLANHTEQLKDVTIYNALPIANSPELYSEKSVGSFNFCAGFYSPWMRRLHNLGICTYIPVHMQHSAEKFANVAAPINIYVVATSLPDEHGYVSLGPSAVVASRIMGCADIVIAEMNKNIPRTFGDTVYPLSAFNYMYESDLLLPCLPETTQDETDKIIGQYVADLIEDGSTVQLGIGGIPNAAALELINHKHLGVHTEMLTDSVVDLFHAGVIDNSQKTIYKNKMVATFTFGTQKLYDFINNNPTVLHLNSAVTNDPYVIAQNYKMVSLNSTLAIDLVGQCASESLGMTQISGVGGQVDTARGSQMSRGGKSIIAFHSTAMVKDAQTGEMKTVSRVNAAHDPGTIITLQRSDVNYVITEYGVRNLKNTTVSQRVERLISIAHPDFRDELSFEARKMKLI
jgi:acyl-CoA hydrolase